MPGETASLAKTRRNMERATAIVLLTYAIALVIDVGTREWIYQEKSKLYSGVFTLVRHCIWLARETIEKSTARAYFLFSSIIIGSVRTNIRSSVAKLS